MGENLQIQMTNDLGMDLDIGDNLQHADHAVVGDPGPSAPPRERVSGTNVP